MNFNLNIKDILFQILPNDFRQTKYLSYLYSIGKALQTLNDRFYGNNSLTDYGSYIYWKYQLQFSGQTIYLEHYLNDNYDEAQRRIYIQNTAGGRLYLFNKDENIAPVYFYNLWDSSNLYNDDEYCAYQNIVWKDTGLGSNQNKQPGSTGGYWEDIGEKVQFCYNLDETTGVYDFIVWIPDGVKYACGYPDYDKMKKQIEFFKVAGKRFIILVF